MNEEMIRKIADFLMIKETDLKVLGYIMIVSILLSPVIYKVVFIEPFWFLKLMK